MYMLYAKHKTASQVLLQGSQQGNIEAPQYDFSFCQHLLALLCAYCACPKLTFVHCIFGSATLPNRLHHAANVAVWFDSGLCCSYQA